MTIGTDDLTDRVAGLVESIGGIRRCRVRMTGEEVDLVTAAVSRGARADELAREIRAVLRTYLGLTVAPEKIRVERSDADEGGDSEPEGPGIPSATSPDTERDPSGNPPGDPPGARGGGRKEGRDAAEVESPGSVRPPSEAPREMEIVEYRVVGGRGPSVQVQVALGDGAGRTFEGAVPAESLAAVDFETFVRATVRAGQSLIDSMDRAGGRPTTRILDEAGQADEVTVGGTRFLAVTLEVRAGGDRYRATGFEPVAGKVGADVAIGAALDSLRRLARGGGVPSTSEPSR